MLYLVWWIIAFNVMVISSAQTLTQITEQNIQSLLDEYNLKAVDLCRAVKQASWDVATDVGNKEKETKKGKAVVAYAEFQKYWWNKYWKNVNNTDYQNETVKRQLFFVSQLGDAALEDNRLKFLTSVIINMTSIYNSATVCPFEEKNCSDSSKNRLTLDPDITARFAESRNYDELEYLWLEWREKTGKLMRSNYMDYVDVMNEVARENGYKDASVYWKADFEDDNFENLVDSLWTEVEPFYDDLHTYMRYKLISIYGDKIDRSNKNIPAHLLGNMWAQSWQNLYDDTKPFNTGENIDLTAKMQALKFDELKMFDISNEFYMSLELPTNNMSYMGDAVIIKPTDRIIQCHASAWDFCDGKDFRIKMCTNVNEEDLIVIHHEMGHIQYFIQYKDQPLVLRRGANPGFHEAVGDTMALSVANPYHLVKIGLLDEYKSTTEENINALYKEALQRVAFLPFGLLIDKWRWDVFSKQVEMKDWNAHWWTLRTKYQKISPPIPRTDGDFDPGAKFHVAANSKYISYFVSHILEFSFYKALCIEAGEYETNNTEKLLHKCDFFQSKKAGRKLADGLKLGGSKHWKEALKAITGESEMSADAILEYFKPLREFLITENKRLAKEDEIRTILRTYDKEASIQCNKVNTADWDKTTDLNNKTKEEIYSNAVAENAKFIMDQYERNFAHLNPNDFPDENVRRQIQLIQNLGTNILNETDLVNLTNTISEMVKIYNQAEFCSYDNQNCTEYQRLSLEPEMTEIMATSKNYSELEYTWRMWHDSTGPLMKPLYKKYIELSNKAATLNGFKDAGDMWRSKYEDPNFIENMKKIWKRVEPLYNELHTYTRNKLIKIYGDHINSNDTLIPAHLLGNMWAQSWVNLYDRIKPFSTSSDIDITASLLRNNFTALKIFQESDRFYQSLGLESNNMSYTGASIIEKPDDRLIVCHASAWDFCDGKDFRIKQCTTVSHRHFITAHHEMGHIQYYILYKDQPLPFRQGANPGFHEAVGDTMALSVSNPTHLKKVNLLDNYKDTAEDNINALFKMALERVAFLPFGFLIDLYRYDLFSGEVSEENWNQHWEQLREEYQKVRSPVKRNSSCFDAGAKFHVPSDYPYVAYFVAHILEFQFLRSLCIAAGQYEPNNPEKPLHKCDIQDSQIAGKRLRDGLSLGLSKHWSESLSIITNGERDISADAILEYFKPLHDFLILENQKNNRDSESYKMLYVIGGFTILILVVAIISCGIYYFNRK